MHESRAKIDHTMLDLKDTVVSINRVTKVVKGGKNLSFSALIVVGDGLGHVGVGIGKAKEVPSAIKKGIETAKKSLIRVPLQETVDPHAIIGRFGAGRVLLKPAPEGTGIIAGGAVRAVVESAGIQNIVTKSLGSDNPHNVVRATIIGLEALKAPADVARLRGLELEQLECSESGTGHEKRKRNEQAERITVTLVRSPIGFDKRQSLVVRGLGLRRIGHSVDVVDNRSIRGMIHKVRHLVRVG